jgi:thiosulfate/3-mercaptopyruvate sulfurtransferase
MKVSRIAICILLMVAIFAGGVSSVNGECSACKGGSPTAQQDVLNNEWAVFLGKENASSEVMTSTDGLVNPRYNRQNNPSLQAEKNPASFDKRSDSFASVLVPLESANKFGIILDISPDPTELIPGAISIPYGSFLNKNKQLKPVSELAQILGKAGISEDDEVLIYGECAVCGGGPSAATYVYWVMKYLGHKKVSLLDGGIDDWVKAMQPTVSRPASLSPKNYTASLNAGLLATYEYVHSGAPTIIDVRKSANFEAGSIPNAVSIPYTSVLDGKKIKDEASVQKVFSSISRDLPVVVYSNAGIEASMSWLMLTLLGYDAKIYSWQDWQANMPQLNIALQKAYAQPNPAQKGDVGL